jgi:hypothetical protein
MQLKLSESRLTRIKRSRHQETEEPIIIADSGESFVAKRLFLWQILRNSGIYIYKNAGQSGLHPGGRDPMRQP